MQRVRKTTLLCLCSLFTALIIAGAYIRVPLPGIPFTLQYEFTMLAGVLLGKKYGTVSVAVYLLLGIIGFPVFSQGGGISYVLMPGFGYILGFLPGTYITGLIARSVPQPDVKRLLVADLAGMLIVYICGMLYMYIAGRIWLADGARTFGELFISGFLLLAPADIIMCVITAFVSARLVPVSEKYI